MLLLLLLALISFAGCSRAIVLHPIEKSDIYAIKKGQQCGDIVSEKDGWFISEYYLDKVVEAKIH